MNDKKIWSKVMQQSVPEVLWNGHKKHRKKLTNSKKKIFSLVVLSMMGSKTSDSLQMNLQA